MLSIILDEDDMERAKAAEPPTQKKRRHNDNDQDPLAGSDQEMKKSKKSKDTEPSKKTKQAGSSKGITQYQPKSTGNNDEQPNDEAAPKTDKSRWFKQPPRPPTPDLKWNKGKSSDHFTIFSKEHAKDVLNWNTIWKNGRLTVPANFFFNNDLEYLRAGNTERQYTTSITKTKAARYKLKVIEDMVPKVWSPVKVAYNKDAAFGISH
ncbi:hypothetical protein Tco_0950135 [Tanacetum coccineum]